MNLLLINICLRQDVEKILYPVGLSYIASAVHRAGHRVEIIDMDARRMTYEEFERELSSRSFDVFGFGCIVTGYKIVKTLSGIVRRVKPEARIICGNSVASSIPELLLQKTEVDIAVIGEGDETIVELLDGIQRGADLRTTPGIAFKLDGEIVHNTPRKVITDIDEIPYPDWELFDMERYLSMSSKYVSEPYPIPPEQIRAFAVNTARGCAFDCSFCYHVFKNCRYRYRSPENILGEIRILVEGYGVNYINFWDELTFLSKPQTEKLVDEILASGLHFHWTAACRGNLFSRQDHSLLAKVKSAGCVGLGFSLESANRGILKAMNKKLNPDDFAEQVKALKAAGIVTWTSLVIGYPEETEETIQETFQFCFDNAIYPSAGFLLPQPGTPVYQYAISKGFIKDEESYLLDMGDRQDLRLNLTQIPTQKMDQLVRGHLSRIRDKLQIELTDEQLLKSGKYRSRTE